MEILKLKYTTPKIKVYWIDLTDWTLPRKGRMNLDVINKTLK